MADFEGLIRQALARQNDADPAIREKVYQSSRKALARMIASAGVQPPGVITRQQTALEDSIRRIEADYQSRHTPSRDTDEREPAFLRRRPGGPDRARGPGLPPGGKQPVPVPEPPGARRQEPRIDVGRDQPRHDPEDDVYDEEDDRYSDYGDDYRPMPERRAPSALRRIVAVLALLAILGVLGWLGYTLFVSIMGSWQSPPVAIQTIPTDGGGAAEQDALADAGYITILSPADTSALQTAGRGKAGIVTQSNLEMIRLVSVRSTDNKAQPAPPILITLQDGVLSQIAGKRVTVEILAKSGSSGPATFAVGCEFAGEDLCGRKRFRVGIQPEAIVFTVNVRADLAAASPAHLTISTDITSTASLTGEGEAVDILYARLRLPE